MIDRLRELSAPLRYVVYVASLLLLFMVAVGVGAAAAVVLSWQADQGTGGFGGPARSGMLGNTMLETTGNSSNTDPRKPAEDASFVHRATDENSRGDYTYINDPRIDGDPEAAVLVAPSPDRGRTGASTYSHNIGVWYEPGARKWAIFNQDRAPMSPGAAFEVTIPRASEVFLHRAAQSNIIGNSTYLDDPLANGEPDAVLSVTQNWNPGGGGGVYNDHAVDVLYDESLEQWLIYNKDDAPMPNGAAFNVTVSGSARSDG